jgi:hypothetical protein
LRPVATLKRLELVEIGPADHFIYEPAPRLNILTGENSLGKTMVLDAAWWSLTGDWLGTTLHPRRTETKHQPRIAFEIASPGRKSRPAEVQYDWTKHGWVPKTKRQGIQQRYPGLLIYARHDGSLAIWDSARGESGEAFLLKADEIWEGKRTDDGRQLCEGLLQDWTRWQLGGARYQDRFSALRDCLGELSSDSESQKMVLGEPMRLPGDVRELPTLRMPYGDVPLPHSSAGVRRISALAYALVWVWNEHLVQSELSRREPQKNIVMLIDEVEAHLHPRWQRSIVPSLMKVIKRLESDAIVQLHLATHSPMILASAEPNFDAQTDCLHLFKSSGASVLLEDISFFRRGCADLWLTSEVFGLKHARSNVAEKNLALQDGP